MMYSEDSYACLIANNAEELLQALKGKPNYILITKDYKEEFLDKSEWPMGEESYLSETRVAAGSPLFHLINLFSKKGKTQRKIDGKIQRYLMKKSGQDILLSLRQLNY